MRIATVIGFLLTLLAGPSVAGDVAALEILGFSRGGGVFAFEEYGVQDGSGFPYANRFYIDTTTDTFLPGTPIRVRIDDETAGLDTVRQQARQKGEAIVPQAELTANRGFTAGLNPVTELSADPHRMAVNPRPIVAPVDPPLEFRLEELRLAGTEFCESIGEIRGFRLLRVGADAGAETVTVHEDRSIPASRGCPEGYGIGGIQTYDMNSLSAYAVLIWIRRYGFEGPDYRWIAVTGRL